MWYAKNTYGYVDGSVEANANATSMANILYTHNWTKGAVCAAIGNASAGESNLNPWRWESEHIPTLAEFTNWTTEQARSHGYGLFQFTPANKYINPTNEFIYVGSYFPNFADDPGQAIDGEGQMLYFAETGIRQEWGFNQSLYSAYRQAFQNVGVNIDSFWNIALTNFLNGVDNNNNPLSLAELTGAFELGYERPDVTNAANSYNARVTSAQYYDNYLPDPPTPTSHRKMPWIYYLKRRRF